VAEQQPHHLALKVQELRSFEAGIQTEAIIQTGAHFHHVEILKHFHFQEISQSNACLKEMRVVYY
jgi:hypothetical protein